MRRTLACLLAVAGASLIAAGAAFAQSNPEFRLGFKLLAEQAPGVVGEPLENEHAEANGDSLQRTSKGLMVWRKADNWTAFTDGSRSWVNGPYGVMERANDERFPWEPIAAYAPIARPLYAAAFGGEGWRWESGGVTSLNATLTDGEYRCVFSEAERSARSIVWKDAPESFDLRAEVRFTGGLSDAGLVFNRSAGSDAGYNFVLRSDGSYTVSISLRGGESVLSHKQAPLFVRDGGVNALRVVRASDGAAFYLNGERLGTMRRASLSGREVGVRMANHQDPRAEITWRSLAIYPLDNVPNPTVSTDAPEEGWIRLEKPMVGIAISVPGSWAEYPLDPKAGEGWLEAVRARDPSAAERVAAQMERFRDGGLDLVAVDLSPEHLDASFTPSINVIAGTAPAGMTLDRFVQLHLDQYEQMASTVRDLTHRRVSTRAGEAEEMRLQLRVAISPETESWVAVTQYAGLVGGRQYVVTMGVAADRGKAYGPIFETIGRNVEMK